MVLRHFRVVGCSKKSGVALGRHFVQKPELTPCGYLQPMAGNPRKHWKMQNPAYFHTQGLDISVVPPGIEPGTQGFSVLCSTD